MLKNRIGFIFLCMAAILFSASGLCSEEKYVNIQALREEAPACFQGEYVTKQGNAVAINCKIIIPEVLKVPVVRVTWGGTREVKNGHAEVTENNRNVLKYHQKIVPHPSEYMENMNPSSENAEKWLIQNICRDVPEMNSENFECMSVSRFQYKDRDGGFYLIFYAPLYHGIPYLCNAPYVYPADEPDLPGELISGSIEDENHYSVSLSFPRELMLEEEDVPLLSFSQIIKIVEERIENGYIHSLDEIRLAYRIYIDPEKPGKEYILAPVWIFSGNMRGLLDVPFLESKVPYMQFKNSSSFAINAQTGEVYSFASDQRKNRQYAPPVLTWEQVKEK